MIEFVFYLFSAVMLAGAFSVITVRNPVYAALFLVLTFFSAAAIWMLLEVEFLAITLVLVYVGAVMVLFLFVVMMLDVNLVKLKEGFASYLPVGALVAVAMVVEIFLVIWSRNFDQQVLPPGHPEGYSNSKALGEWLYTQYLYPFEIAAVILLVAIIAAIALTHRRRPLVRSQDPAKQVQVKKSERLKVVKMDSEP